VSAHKRAQLCTGNRKREGRPDVSTGKRRNRIWFRAHTRAGKSTKLRESGSQGFVVENDEQLAAVHLHGGRCVVGRCSRLPTGLSLTSAGGGDARR
jgi:hypothetical protein